MEIQDGITGREEAGDGDVIRVTLWVGGRERAGRGDEADDGVGDGRLGGERAEFGGEDVEEYVEGVDDGDGEHGDAWR